MGNSIEEAIALDSRYSDLDQAKILLEYAEHALSGGWPNVQSPHYALAGAFQAAAGRIASQGQEAETLRARVAVLTEAVERALRHAQNIGITDGSYIAQLEAALLKGE